MSDVVRIDDLREPRLDAAQRAALDYVATIDVSFDVDELLATAVERAGCCDFGEPDFRPRLERMVAAKGLTTGEMLARYRDAWDRAADRTPHGTPIEANSSLR